MGRLSAGIWAGQDGLQSLSAQGIWQSIFEAAAEPAEPPERMALDSRHGKAHRCAGGGKGGVGTGDWHHQLRAQQQESLLEGIAELLGDKAYDSNSFRKSLRKDGIKSVIPGRSNRKKRNVTTSKPIRIARSSSAATAGSRASGASQCATTNSLGTTSQPCASLSPWHSGSSRARVAAFWDNMATCRHPG